MTWTARISSRAAAAPPSDTASAPPTSSSWIPSAVCHVSRQSQSLANPKVGVQNVCRANNGAEMEMYVCVCVFMCLSTEKPLDALTATFFTQRKQF